MAAGDQLPEPAGPQQTGLHDIFPVDLVSSQKKMLTRSCLFNIWPTILGLTMQTFRQLGENLG